MADLAQAVALFRGDFLEGFYDDQVLDERYSLEALFLQSKAPLMRRYEVIGGHEAALASAQRLLRHDPLREEAHRVAMQAYGRDVGPAAGHPLPAQVLAFSTVGR